MSTLKEKKKELNNKINFVPYCYDKKTIKKKKKKNSNGSL